MGLFKATPQSRKEQRIYEEAKASALKTYNTQQSMTRVEKLKAQARMDALPRTERAKQRLSKGYGALKLGAAKLKALDDRLEARARAQGYQGGVIQQGYKQDFQAGAQRAPLLQQRMVQDQAKMSDGIIQKSLTKEQGDGLIVNLLKQQGRKR